MKQVYETEEERIKARREAARRWKKRNKHRRRQGHYFEDAGQTRKKKPSVSAIRAKQQKKLTRLAKIDEWFDRLRKKHAGKPRLTKSIKPPIPLILGDDE